jgi:glycosyltransferase involved in cell wall biosynthesis
LNIAFATPVIYPFVKGGAEKRIHEIGSRLTRRGHKITVYSRHWWDGKKNRIHAGMQLRAVGPPTELYTDGDRRSISSALGLAGRLTKPIARSTHDLIITPVAPYFHIFSTRLSTAIRQTPLVVTWHEVWDDYWYRHMGSTGWVGKIIERLAGHLPQHAVAPSRTTARKLQSLASASPVEVIPNGIDFDYISSKPPINGGCDVLYAGRLIEDKNIDLLIDSFDQCDTDACLTIVGDGPAADQLHNHAAQSTVTDQIEFVGFLEEYDDVIAYMRAADIFVSPSIREGFGLTLLEAMAAGCTVITVDHKYSAGNEIVGDAGFVVEPTVNELSEILSQALDGARPNVPPTDRAANYDWKSITNQAESFYESLI